MFMPTDLQSSWRKITEYRGSEDGSDGTDQPIARFESYPNSNGNYMYFSPTYTVEKDGYIHLQAYIRPKQLNIPIYSGFCVEQYDYTECFYQWDTIELSTSIQNTNIVFPEVSQNYGAYFKKGSKLCLCFGIVWAVGDTPRQFTDYIKKWYFHIDETTGYQT